MALLGCQIGLFALEAVLCVTFCHRLQQYMRRLRTVEGGDQPSVIAMLVVLKSVWSTLAFLAIVMVVEKLFGVFLPMICEPSVAAEVTSANAAIERGNAFADNRDFDSAISAYTEAIRLTPRATTAETTKLYSLRATAYYLKGDFGQAISDYTKALQLSPNREDLFLLRYRLLAEQRS